MTGFGLGDAPLGGGRLVVEVRAVNARFLDTRVRLPRALADSAPQVEGDVRKRLGRGRVDLVVRTEGAVFSAPTIDSVRARGAYHSLLALRDELTPEGEVPLSMLTALPDLFVSQLEHDFDAVRGALSAALTSALDAMDTMRKVEGGALASELRERSTSVRSHIDALVARAPELVAAYRTRLKERVERLLADLGGREARTAGSPRGLDPERLEQEVALFVERSDIAEELLRIKSHLAQFDGYVARGEPTGRRLDFLLQEMAREINTVGSKSQDVSIAHVVVELKVEIERMREQVQNVE